jgi:hypothetical protein
MAKRIKSYTLCRTTTTLEYCSVFAGSTAEARRLGFPQRKRIHKSTKWRVVGTPVDFGPASLKETLREISAPKASS